MINHTRKALKKSSDPTSNKPIKTKARKNNSGEKARLKSKNDKRYIIICYYIYISFMKCIKMLLIVQGSQKQYYPNGSRYKMDYYEMN